MDSDCTVKCFKQVTNTMTNFLREAISALKTEDQAMFLITWNEIVNAL